MDLISRGVSEREVDASLTLLDSLLVNAGLSLQRSATGPGLLLIKTFNCANNVGVDPRIALAVQIARIAQS